MSRTVENRIVEMTFKNDQFEKAVTQSIKSIHLLDSTLKMNEGVNHLRSLDKVANSIDFSSAVNGVTSLNSKFTALGVAGISAVATLSSTITSKLISALSEVGKLVPAVFNQIYEGGRNRAFNIEQAKFSLQGLLTAEYEDANIIAKKTDQINKKINDSVDGTAYSFDKAAKAASTLVASFGSSDQGIERVGAALNNIAGLAGQTGANYESIADIVTKIAGQGSIMGDEIRRFSGYGMNVSKDILKAVEKDDALVKTINQALSTKNNKRSDTQKLTEADIRDAAGKRLISADLFFEATEKYFENAKKANDTFNGVTDNIKAALSRIGAAFIEPLIRNEGEVVQFLQVLRQKVVDFLKVLNNLNIPENVTNTLNFLVTRGKDILEGFDVSKITLLDRLGGAVENFSKVLGTINETPTNFEGVFRQRALANWQSDYENNFKNLNQLVQEVTGSSRDSYNRLVEFDKTYGDEVIYRNGMTAREILDQVDQMHDAQVSYFVDSKEEALEAADRMAAGAEELNSIWSYDYISTFAEALGTLGSAFKTVFTTIGDIIGEQNPQLKAFIDILTGKDTSETGKRSLREMINSLAESMLNFANKVKDFVENNQSFKSVLKGIASLATLVLRAFNAIKEIGINMFHSFEPLIQRIFTLIGTFGEFFGTIVGKDDEIDGFGKVVSVVSGIVDKFAQILISAYDGLENVIKSLTGNDSLTEWLKGIGTKLSPVGSFISGVFDKITNAIKTFFDFIAGKASGISITENPNSLFSQIKNFIAGLFGYGKSPKDSVGMSSLDDTAKMVDASIEALPTEKITSAFNTIKKWYDAIKEKITEIVENFDPKKFMSVCKTAADIFLEIATGFSLLRGSKGFKSFTDIFKNLKSNKGESSIFGKGSITGNFSVFGMTPETMKTFTTSITATINSLKKSFGLVETVKEFRKPEKYQAIAEIIKSIALVIIAFAASFILMAVALSIVANLVATYSPSELTAAVGIMFIFAAIVAGVTIAIILLARKLQNSDSTQHISVLGKAFEMGGNKNSASGILGMIAGIILVIGVYMILMAKSLEIIAKIPADRLWPAVGTLAICALIIAALLAGILVFVGLMKRHATGDVGDTKKIVKIMAEIIALISAITAAMKSMVKSLKILTTLNPSRLKDSVDVLESVAWIVGLLLAEILVFTYVLSTSASGDTKGMLSTLLGIAAVMFVLGGVITELIGALAILAVLPVKNMEDAIAAFGAVTAGIGILLIVAAVVSKIGDPLGMIGSLIGLSMVVGAMALLFLAFGGMVALFGASGFTADEVVMVLDALTTIIGIMLSVVAILAVIGGFVPELDLALVAIALVAAALGLMVTGIGVGVVLIGAGILLFAEAIKILIDTFNLLTSEQIDKIIGTMTLFFMGLAGVVVNGFIAFAKAVTRMKKPIISAITTLLSIVLEAFLAFIPAMIQSFLDTAGAIIDSVSAFLDEYAPEIMNIIDKLFIILWEAIQINSAGFVKWLLDTIEQIRVELFGEDGMGGTAEDWLASIGGFVIALFNELIRISIENMTNFMNAVSEKAPELADTFGQMVEDVIDGITVALVEHGPAIIDKVRRLMRVVIELAKYALGLRDSPPLMSEFATDPGKKGDPDEMGEGFGDEIGSGLENSNIVKNIKAFINKLKVTLIKWAPIILGPAGQILADCLIKGYTDETQTESPSKVAEELGYYFDQGLSNGVRNNTNQAENAGRLLAQTMVDATHDEMIDGANEIAKDTPDIIDKLIASGEEAGATGTRLNKMLAGIKSTVSSFIDNFDLFDSLGFTITPEMDLSKIEEGTGNISDLFGNTNGELSVSASDSTLDFSGMNVDDISSMSGDFDIANGLGDISAEDLTSGSDMSSTVVNFTQNNYSPESLSRIDIYRDTDNMLNNPSITSLFKR